MDEYAEFASDDFDVKGWINATVAGHLELAKDSGGAIGNGVTAGEPPSLSSSTSHRRDLCLRAGDHVVLHVIDRRFLPCRSSSDLIILPFSYETRTLYNLF